MLKTGFINGKNSKIKEKGELEGEFVSIREGHHLNVEKINKKKEI